MSSPVSRIIRGSRVSSLFWTILRTRAARSRMGRTEGDVCWHGAAAGKDPVSRPTKAAVAISRRVIMRPPPQSRSFEAGAPAPDACGYSSLILMFLNQMA